MARTSNRILVLLAVLTAAQPGTATIAQGSQTPPSPAVTPPPPNLPSPFIVFFDWDDAGIKPVAAPILDNAIDEYRSTFQGRVLIAGHADRSGPAGYNVGLSRRRVDNVRRYFTERGVPTGAIIAGACGESLPLVETRDGARDARNRRVEIMIAQILGGLPAACETLDPDPD